MMNPLQSGLIKTISLLRFSKAVNRFYQRMSETPTAGQLSENKETQADYLFLKADKKRVKVFFHDILYFESFGDYLIVHTNHEKITIKERISHMEEQLPANLFLRVHRGYIVSLKKITALLLDSLKSEQTKSPSEETINRKLKTSPLTQIKS